jgi:hypothetical protein
VHEPLRLKVDHPAGYLCGLEDKTKDISKQMFSVNGGLAQSGISMVVDIVFGCSMRNSMSEPRGTSSNSIMTVWPRLTPAKNVFVCTVSHVDSVQ